MKTFIVNGGDRITLTDNGGIIFADWEFYPNMSYIAYNPNKKRPWSYKTFCHFTAKSKTLTGLEIPKYELDKLHKALVLVNKQDLIDDEIVFVRGERKI